MTSRDAVLSLEDTELEFGSLSERLIYLYLRFHADRKGVVRLSMAELAAQLRVNRQTVVKHVDALQERHLVTRQGHGRYRVHAEPWSPKEVARAYFKSLAPGDEWDIVALEHRAYGRTLLDTDEDYARSSELIEYLNALERGGFIREVGGNGTMVRTDKVAAV